MSMPDECPFCNLGERVLKENKLALVILSDPRKVPGHFIVIPKRHIEEPWELTEDELSAIFELIFFVQMRLVEKLSEGCDVRQNYRPFKKQSKLKVDHIHFHVMPRDLEDTLYQRVEKYETDMFVDLPSAEYEKMAKLIKS